jgi:hypothetical protein
VLLVPRHVRLKVQTLLNLYAECVNATCLASSRVHLTLLGKSCCEQNSRLGEPGEPEARTFQGWDDSPAADMSHAISRLMTWQLLSWLLILASLLRSSMPVHQMMIDREANCLDTVFHVPLLCLDTKRETLSGVRYARITALSVRPGALASLRALASSWSDFFGP